MLVKGFSMILDDNERNDKLHLKNYNKEVFKNKRAGRQLIK